MFLFVSTKIRNIYILNLIYIPSYDCYILGIFELFWRACTMHLRDFCLTIEYKFRIVAVLLP